jgi:uridine kinase
MSDIEIVISGEAKSGKSTVTKIIETALKEHGIKDIMIFDDIWDRTDYSDIQKKRVEAIKGIQIKISVNQEGRK